MRRALKWQRFKEKMENAASLLILPVVYTNTGIYLLTAIHIHGHLELSL